MTTATTIMALCGECTEGCRRTVMWREWCKRTGYWGCNEALGYRGPLRMRHDKKCLRHRESSLKDRAFELR
jgi:hypothetical protein